MFGFGKQKPDNVQDFLSDSLFESAPTDMEQALKFFKDHGVTLSLDQREGLTQLRVLGGYEDIIAAVHEFRHMSMPTVQYRKIIETMAKAQAAASNPSMVGVMAADKGKK